MRLTRGADVNQNYVVLALVEKTGPALGDQVLLEALNPNGGWYYGVGVYPFAPLYFRVERAGGVLTASWSDDGVAWNVAWSHDLGSALDGLDQQVVLAGQSWFNSGGSYGDWDYVAVEPTEEPVIEVALDVKPGSDPNSLNPRSQGVIPVAFLTTGDFDAGEVDPLTLAFGPAGTGIVHSQGHFEDVDGDGDLDLVVHFRTRETGIACGDTAVTLRGQTLDGQSIEGTDGIRTVGCS